MNKTFINFMIQTVKATLLISLTDITFRVITFRVKKISQIEYNPVPHGASIVIYDPSGSSKSLLFIV